MHNISVLLQREARVSISISCHLLHLVSLVWSDNVKQQFEENLAEQVKVSSTVNGYNNFNNTFDVMTQKFEGNYIAPFSSKVCICQTDKRKYIQFVQRDNTLATHWASLHLCTESLF